MAEYLIQGTTLDAIADAINAKTGGSSAMTPAQMVTAIGNISGGGGNPITKDEWTLASDFNNTTQGFYYTSYVDRSFSGVQIIYIDGNAATSYVAKGAYVDTHYTDILNYAFVRGTGVTVMSSGQSFNITAGSTITRYKIPSNSLPT